MLGPIVISRPVIRSVRTIGSDTVLSWYSVEDLTYVVQVATSLQPGNWTDLPGAVTATDAITSKVIPPPSGPQCFYRVLVR